MTPKSQAVRNGLQKWPPKSPVVMDGLNKVYVSSNSCSPKDGLARMPLPKSDFDSVYHVKSSSQGLSTIDGTRMKSVVNTEKTRNNGTAESNVFKGEGTTTANFSNKGSVTRTTATEETNMFMTAAKKVATSLQAFVTTADASNTHTSKPQISDTHANKPASTSQCRVSRLRQTSAVVAHKANSLSRPTNAREITSAPHISKHTAFFSMENAKGTVKSESNSPQNSIDVSPNATLDSTNFVQRSVITKSVCSKSAAPMYSRKLTSDVEVHACSEGFASSDSALHAKVNSNPSGRVEDQGELPTMSHTRRERYKTAKMNSDTSGPVEDQGELPIMSHTRRERYRTAGNQRFTQNSDDGCRLKDKGPRKQESICVTSVTPADYKSSISREGYSLSIPQTQHGSNKSTTAKQCLGYVPQQSQGWNTKNTSSVTSSTPCVSSSNKPCMSEQSTYPKSPFIKKSVTFNPSRITHVSFSDMESGGVDRQTMSRNPRSGNCITVTSSRSLREPGMSVRRRYRRSASSASASIRSGCTSHASSSSPLPNRALHSSTVPRLGRSVSACGDVPSAANYDSKPADSCVATLAVDSDALSLTVARDPAQDPDSCAISSDTKSPGIWESPGSAYRLHEHTSTPVCAATRGASPRSSVAWDYSAERVSDSSSPAASPTLAHKPKWKDLAEMMRRIRMDPQKVSEVESSRYCGAFGDKGEDGGSSSSERLVKIVLSSVCYELPLRSDLPVRKEHLFDVSDLQHEPPLISKCGSLEVTFTYVAVRGKMTVHVHRAREIPTKDRGGANSTQVRVMLLPTKKQRFKTKVKEGDEPVFDENFVFSKIFTDEIPGLGVRFRLYGLERMRREYMIGESVIGFASLNLVEPSTHWIILEPRSNLSQGDSGFDVASLSRSDSASSMQSLQHGGMPELLLGLAYHATTGRLAVQIVKGSNFRNMATNRPPDTYVKVTLMSPTGQKVQTCKTSIRRGQPNPLFRETFMLQVAHFQLPEVTLMLSVYNKKSMKKKEMIGWFSLGQNSSGEEEGSHWADMRDSKGEEVCRWHVLLES